MGVAYGSSTIYQATKASFQDDLLLNIDAAASNVNGTVIYDLSGRNENGTLTNNPAFNKSFGGYFTFDGTDDRIETNYTTALSNSDFTYEVWVRYTVSNQVANIFSKRTSSNSYEQLTLFISGSPNGSASGAKICVFDSRSGVRSYASPSNYNDGQWHHVVLSADQSLNDKLYIDNTLIATITASQGSATHNSPLIIGAGSDGASPYSGRVNHLNGDIAVARAYNRALTATEVAQNFNVTRHRFGI